MFRRPIRPGRAIAAVLALALAIGSVEGASIAPAIADAAPVIDHGKAVAGTHAKALASTAVPASSTSEVAVAATSIQAATLSGPLTTAAPSEPVTTSQVGAARNATVSSAWKLIGDSKISIASASPGNGKSVALRGAAIAPAKVDVSVLSAADAKSAGLSGLVLSVKRTDGVDTAGPIALKIPNSVLDGMYGANFSSRARWTEVTPAAAGAKSKKPKTDEVASAVEPQDAATIVTPQVSSSRVLLTPMSTPVSSSGTGSFTATSLTPATTWQVSAQTGDFSWSYPMRTPPAAAGPSPSLALNYDSQSVDGETGSTNNQPSAVGEGWSVAGGGFIERQYVSCSLDDGSSGPVTSSGDLCWKTDNATISFGGHSGLLVKDSTSGDWKLQSDDGSRIEHLVGTSAGCAANGTYDTDCWRVTTTDGTQYFFGLNELPGWTSGQPTTNSAWTVPVYGNDSGEPCHASTFATSSCVQAWRWNLDYVVDTHGNAEAYYYDAETNNYSQNGGTGVSYIRGGQLDHISYGFTDTHAYSTNAASDKVTFGFAADGRCSDATLANCSSEPITSVATTPAHPTYYPDVPFDENCTSSSCPGMLSPTFWTDAMLSTVTTSYLSSSGYSNVDVWTLSHSFPDPGDGTSPSLWLTQIDHTGYAGTSSATEPPTVFTGVTMQNRVWPIDGLAPLDKWRISSIKGSLGAVTTVNYSPQECTAAMVPAIEASPQTNTYRCFPQWWTPQITPPIAAQEDLFHKYVVTSVIANPETGGTNDLSQETDYAYGTPAWRYNVSRFIPSTNRTWSDFAGYNTVEVRKGAAGVPASQSVVDYTYYQGMDGDRAAQSGGTKTVYVTGTTTVLDSLWFAGQVRDTETVLGVGGTILSDSVSTPWASGVTASDGTNSARMTAVQATSTNAGLSTGATQTTGTTTTFDSTYGFPLMVENTSSDFPTNCTIDTYATANTTKWIIGALDEVDQVASSCAALGTAVYPAAAISDVRTYYDGGTFGAAPSVGDPTMTKEVDAFTGSTAASAHWVTQSQSTFDAMGRKTQVTDVLGHTTSSAYVPAAGAAVGSGPLTQVTTTNTAPFNWTSTTVMNPEWGVETSVTDAAGSLTSAAYDPLGRRTSVWLPDQSQSGHPTQPSVAYVYSPSATAASAIQTQTLEAGVVVSSYDLFDGLGRGVQTQSPAEGGGSTITDTLYDSQGRPYMENASYWAAGTTASSALFVPTSEAAIPSVTVTQYDGASRVTATVLDSMGTEQRRTSIVYNGVDRADSTPPGGGTPTSSFTDSRGLQTKLVQYLASTPLSSAPQESTSYTYDASGRMTAMTDPAGNHWTWGFDVLGHQITASDPDTGTTSQSFDDFGNVLTSTDSRGKTLAYAYDALNRKIGQYQNSTGGSGILLDAWTYDSLVKGQLTSSSSYSGSTAGVPGIAYTETVTGYDAGQRATGMTVSIPTGAPAFGGNSYTNSMAYNTGGLIASVTYPAEGGLTLERLRTTYDGLANVASLVGASSYALASYSGIGQPAQYLRNGTTTLYSNYSYNIADGHVSTITQTSNTGATYTTLATSTYGYNPAGEITSIGTTSSIAGADTQCFSYDYLQDLTSGWTPSSNSCASAPTSSGIGGPAPYWTSYTVDPATGNRMSSIENAIVSGGTATTDSYSYPASGSPQPHSVQSITHTTGGAPTTSVYGYDATGDTTTRPGQSLSYNAAGNLTTISSGATSQTSIYDANGQLLLQSDPTTGSTLYLGATQLHVAPGSSAASAVRTYTVNGTPIAERDTTAGISGSVLQWLGVDAQNTAYLEVLPTTGAAVRRYEDPFGNSRGTAVTWSSKNSFLNQSASIFGGLETVGARQYDTSLGRFLTVDTVLTPSDPQQNNGYSYAQNDPITREDPTGLCSTSDDSSGCWGHFVEPIASEAAAPGVVYSAPKTSSSSSYSAANYCDEFGCGANRGVHAPLDTTVMSCSVNCSAGWQLTPADRTANRKAIFGATAGISAVFFATCIGDFAQPICWGGAVTRGAAAADDTLSGVVAAQEAKAVAAASKSGAWVSTGESMSARAAAYQEQITGHDADLSFKLNGVKFDGFEAGVLQDAKGPGYASFINNQTGKFYTWYRGAASLVNQAGRQETAAGGVPITWSVAEESSTAVIQNLLNSAGYTNITVKYVAPNG